MGQNLRNLARRIGTPKHVPGEEYWYELYNIDLFSKLHIAWLMLYLPSLRRGEWPNALDCEYGGSQAPPFRTPIELAAEIDRRIERCDKDGAMLELYYSGCRSYKSISKQFGLNVRYVIDHIEQALKYLADSEAYKKQWGYQYWRRQHNYH